MNDREYKTEPIDALARLILDGKRGDGLDFADVQTRKAYVDAVTHLSFCRDTMALLEFLKQSKPGMYGNIRNTFSPEKDD